ncbi:uncharacterized protein LOC121740611 [Aricia agestis]|uniref:uncharacterized protein LOC121740611 n=1 Tax=Aricia agestis TaxID=91739 RepID=UPI001C208445|nr:uncharacterized protein LOC121740611 [Aricia agestis]
MELNNPILKFHPNTVIEIRKQYGLDAPGRMDEAIDILEEWVKKQEHFTVKTFPRGILERIIINNKGSLETSKKKLDKACTFRTIFPNFYESMDLHNYIGYKLVTCTLLPKMTPDHGRIIIFKCHGNRFDQIQYHYKYFLLACEYLQAFDYSTGLSFVVDLKEINIVEFVRAINVMDVKKVMDIATEGYSMRLKGIHIISDSKAVDLFATLLRQVLKAKIGQRISCHKYLESLYEIVPRDILPKDYGGDDKTVVELRDDLLNELCSEKIISHCKAMNEARTNENYRLIADFNEEYLGMAGTFRTLTVD